MGDVGMPEQDPVAFVTDRYLHFLARPPAAAELEGFVRELKAGASPKLVLRALLTHAEYQTY